MDIVNYVNKTGKLVNDSTKYIAKLDKTSITNIVLISHFNDLLNWMKTADSEYEITQEDKDMINRFILCMKKEMNFYPEKLIDPDCILTEVSEHIIQE